MVDNRGNDDVVPRIIMSKNDTEMDILKILKNEYPLLYNSVLKENYEFSNHEASIFKELLFNNKVVGFVVYDVFFSIFTITDLYILPKFRDKNILLKEIHEVYGSGNKINFYRPNRDIVELLIEYGFAINIVDGIVVSGMNFEFEDYKILSNTTYFRDDNEIPATNLYDLNICSAIYTLDFSNPHTYTLFYYDQSQKDFEKYGSIKEVDDNYLDEISLLLYENGENLKNAVIELKNKLPKSRFGFNEIVGVGKTLTPFFQEVVDDGVITENRAYEIKKQLTEEYQDGLVNDDGINVRFNFLLQYDIFKEFMLPVDPYAPNGAVCPFCGNTFMLSESHCSICGFNLDTLSEGNYHKKYHDVVNLFEDDEEVYEKLRNPYFSHNNEFSNELFMKLVEDEDKLESFLNLLDEDIYSSSEKKLLNFIFKVLDNDKDTIKKVITHSMGGEEFESIFMEKVLENPDYFFEFMTLMDDEFEEGDDFEFFSEYKLDNTVYGKDYPIDYDYEIYQVLTLIHEGASFRRAVMFVNQDSKLDFGFFREMLLEQNFIYTNWQRVGYEHRVTELKDFLRDNNLKVSGNKQVLINRLDENNVIIDSDFYNLTDEGIEFLNKNNWIDFFDDFLFDFNFNDFSKLKDENPNMDIITLANTFLDMHIELAEKSDDELYLFKCNEAKKDILDEGVEYIEDLKNNDY